MALIYRREDVEHPLNGHGFLVPKVERQHVTACTWMNTKFSHRVPDDKVALRCFVHGDPDKTEDDIRVDDGHHRQTHRAYRAPLAEGHGAIHGRP